MRTAGPWTAVFLSILTVALPGIGLGRASAADARRISGTSGMVSWEVVDIIQTRLPEDQALRWDFTVVLTADRNIQFERIEIGSSRVSRKFEERLDAKGEIRVPHADRTRSGDQSMVSRRWYYGKDDVGNPVTVEVRFDLDSTVGGRSVPTSAVRVTSPTAGVPLPWDARIVPPAARIPIDVAGFSGLWIGMWSNGVDHVLVVEEVGERDALVTYARGIRRGFPEPGWERSRAQVQQKQLTVRVGWTAVVTYERLEDGRLYGVWRRRGTEAVVVWLVRQPVGPSQPVAASAAPDVRAASLAREAWQDLLDGRYADALPKAQQALALREQVLGPDHLEVAASLNTLGEIYRTHGRFDDAERVHRRALTIREQHLGPGHPDVATTLNNLAMLHNARAVYAKAESLLKRALQILEQAKGTPQQNRRLESEILENLAKVYRALGRIAEAEEAQAKAMMLWATQ